LTENVARNGLEDTIRVYPDALLDREATVPLRLTALSGNRSLFARADASAEAAELVHSVPLGGALDLCGAPALALLKLDVEGAELEILEGASDATLARVARVVLEYHDFIRAGCCARVKQRLARAGFTRIETGLDAVDGAIGILRAARA
jgi:FkbM family methyltransferase